MTIWCFERHNAYTSKSITRLITAMTKWTMIVWTQHSSGATINGIEVAVEGNRTSDKTLDIALSWDNAAHFTASQSVGRSQRSDYDHYCRRSQQHMGTNMVSRRNSVTRNFQVQR